MRHPVRMSSGSPQRAFIRRSSEWTCCGCSHVGWIGGAALDYPRRRANCRRGSIRADRKASRFAGGTVARQLHPHLSVDLRHAKEGTMKCGVLVLLPVFVLFMVGVSPAY